jgi:hypothetical protein
VAQVHGHKTVTQEQLINVMANANTTVSRQDIILVLDLLESAVVVSLPEVDRIYDLTTNTVSSTLSAGRKTTSGYLFEGLLNIKTCNPHFKKFHVRETMVNSKCMARAALVRQILTVIFLFQIIVKNIVS